MELPQIGLNYILGGDIVRMNLSQVFNNMSRDKRVKKEKKRVCDYESFDGAIPTIYE
jgi:hypothetical protein